jgi:hypothetical protein
MPTFAAAASGAKLGWGTALFKCDTTGYTNPVQVAEVTQIGTPSQERERVEVTHLASPAAKREYIAGLGDTATLDAEANWRPDSITQDEVGGIVYDYDNSITRYWQVDFEQTWTDGQHILNFTAYVAKYQVNATPGDALKITFGLQLTSASTWS